MQYSVACLMHIGNEMAENGYSWGRQCIRTWVVSLSCLAPMLPTTLRVDAFRELRDILADIHGVFAGLQTYSMIVSKHTRHNVSIYLLYSHYIFAFIHMSNSWRTDNKIKIRVHAFMLAGLDPRLVILIYNRLTVWFLVLYLAWWVVSANHNNYWRAADLDINTAN